MCKIEISSNTSTQFIIANTIMSNKSKFDIEQLKNEVIKLIQVDEQVIQDCLDDFIQNGLLYKDGMKFVVNKIRFY